MCIRDRSRDAQGELKARKGRAGSREPKEVSMVKDYIDTNDFTKDELLGMVDLAIAMKGLIKELSLIHI